MSHTLLENAHAVLDQTGKVMYYEGTITDITEAYELSKQLSYEASHDALTGLINRREFELRLERLLDTAQSDRLEHAVCYLDLDQFKVINDSCGHVAGDELLRQLGNCLLEKVRKVLKIAREPISLETPIGEEEDSHLGDFIEDKKFMLPSEAAVSMNLAEQTRKVLATLTPREEKVLRMRFGIGEKADHTLEEVGQDFTVTRERIRQIEAKALRKLRHPTRSEPLRSFLETD